MKAISRRLDRFCYNHPNFGIPNLMLYISAGTAVVYVANLLTNNAVISWLSFMPGMIFSTSRSGVLSHLCWFPWTSPPSGLF